MSLILFLVLLIIFVVELFFFIGVVYSILDFRSINFFMVTKMRKMLKLQVYYKLFMLEWCVHMRTNKNLLPKRFVKILYKNVIKKFLNITLLLKESMILLKRNKM